MSLHTRPNPSTIPQPRAMLELIKPITWFPPMWAYLCGIISVGVWPESWALVVLGVLLAGPIVCGMSQAANDWCDRHVDAINEPHRPIPSGRIPGRWGLYIALIMSVFALFVGYQLGPGALARQFLACWPHGPIPPSLCARNALAGGVRGWWG